MQLPTISLPSFSLNKSWKTALYGPHGDKSVSVVEATHFHREIAGLQVHVGISANGLEIHHPEWQVVANPFAFLGAKLPSDKHEIMCREDFFSLKTQHYKYGFGLHGAPKIFLALHKPSPGNTLDIQLDV